MREENGQRKFHPISWNRLCQPKKEGGLGLCSMRDLNSTFMMKAIWNSCSPPNALWKSFIRAKYNTRSDIFPRMDTTKSGSNY